MNDDSANSFDLDNSDDLNRFISKYETMLDGDGNNKKSSSKLIGKRDSAAALSLGKQHSANKASKGSMTKDRSHDPLEDSWGTLQLQAEQMLGADIEDETSPVKKRTSSTNTSVNTVSAAM